MADKSKIEWCDATWNPVRGCSRLSAGCDFCYAERLASRFSGPGLYAEGFAKQVHGKPHWTGKVALIEDTLERPLHWRKPRRIFVNSMSDLFHESLPFDDIDRVFAVMAQCPQHTFQILTKRSQRVKEYARYAARSKPRLRIGNSAVDESSARRKVRPKWPLPNVHLGVSVEGPETLHRLDVLRSIPNALPWVSLEPLLAPVDIGTHLDFLGWVVVGGESGPGARPMYPDWARAIRDACAEAGVPFFFKQWGAWAQDSHGDMVRVGKKTAGRVLDGRTHNEWPQTSLNHE